MSVFVSAAELNERIQAGQKQTVIAALWEPKAGKAWSKFQSEHIPTALYCDPSVQLAGMPGRRVGRNPMPSIDTVAKAAAGWGIEAGRPVVVYDGGNGLFAARAAVLEELGRTEEAAAWQRRAEIAEEAIGARDADREVLEIDEVEEIPLPVDDHTDVPADGPAAGPADDRSGDDNGEAGER